MPYCPLCQYEYEETISICPDCNEALIDHLPEPDESFMTEDKPAFLCSLDDGIEADVITSLLKGHGIPVMRQSRGSGESLIILMGHSFQGADIYVPSQFVKQAHEILSAQPLPDREDSQPLRDEAKKKPGKIKPWLAILFLTNVLVWLIIYVIHTLFRG